MHKGSEFASGMAEDLLFPHVPWTRKHGEVIHIDVQGPPATLYDHGPCLQDSKDQAEGWTDVVAGLSGGCAGIFVGHPFDTVKVRQQLHQKPITLWNCCLKIFRNEGVRGFYKGMAFPLVAEGVRNAVFFGIYGNLLRQLPSSDGSKVKPGLAEIFLIGGVAGTVQTIIGCPVELVKIKLQAQTGGRSNGTHYRNPAHCLTSIYRNHGLRGCYQGMTVTMLRDFPGCATYITSYEYLTSYFAPDGEHPSVPVLLFSGGMAGMLSWAVNMPVDFIKTRIQEDDISKRRYRGTIDCYRQCLKEGSWTIFWRGLPIICIRAFIINAATFAVYSSSLKALNS